MPAVTLGFEEIEDRLRTVGRRVNLFAAQHVGYVAASALAFAGTALVVAALRGSPQVFSAALLIALIVGFGAVLVAPWLIVRRWRNLSTTAALVDRRAGLQDRLATLLAVRDRQPPSRLASLLMADTLALGRRWEPRVIAPRRIPRSIYVLAAALIALASTAWLSREPPIPAGVVAAGGNAGLQPTDAQSLAGAKVELHPPTATERAAQAAAGSTALDAPAGASSAAQSEGGDQTGSRDGANNSLDVGEPRTDPHAKAFGHQLQQLIQQAFKAQAAGQPQQLAHRDQSTAGADGERRSADQRAQSPGERDRSRGAQGNGPDGKDSKGQQANAADRDGNQGNQSGDRPRNDKQSGESGKGSGAGAGSTGGGRLLAGKNGHGTGASAGGEAKTFKVTLVSFLQSSSVKPAPEPPKSPRGRVSDDGLAASSHEPAALSDEQLGDDLVRKPEIPPEFEEIVRRVYSQRPEP